VNILKSIPVLLIQEPLLHNIFSLSPCFDTDYLDYGKVLSIGQEDQEFEQIYCECEESFNWYFRDNYFGIPLTKEWLVEFGYKKVNDLSNGATAWERRKRGQN